MRENVCVFLCVLIEVSMSLNPACPNGGMPCCGRVEPRCRGKIQLCVSVVVVGLNLASVVVGLNSDARTVSRE